MAFSRRTLSRAIRNGDLDLLERAIASGTSLNRTEGIWTSALHLALDTDTPDQRVIAMLAEAGCALFQANRQGESVVDVARRRGHSAELEFLADADNHGGPTWHREGVALGCPVLVLRVTKGAGFGFDTDDVEQPLRVGGRYDGFGQPLGPAEGKEHFVSLLRGESGWEQWIGWFRPYLDRLVAGEDFSLRRLLSQHQARCEAVHTRELGA